MAHQVAIGVMHDHQIDAPMVQSLVQLMGARREDIHGRIIMHQGNIGHLDIGRNNVIAGFLKTFEAQVLLFIDSDMVFTPTDYDLVMNALTPDHPIVSGLYYREDGAPCAFRWTKEGHSKTLTHVPKNGPVAVDVVGFGFIAIHRTVLTKMAETGQYWCDNARTGPAGQSLADDSSFCYLATELGYPIVVQAAAKLGHVKPVTLYGGKP